MTNCMDAHSVVHSISSRILALLSISLSAIFIRDREKKKEKEAKFLNFHVSRHTTESLRWRWVPDRHWSEEKRSCRCVHRGIRCHIFSFSRVFSPPARPTHRLYLYFAQFVITLNFSSFREKISFNDSSRLAALIQFINFITSRRSDNNDEDATTCISYIMNNCDVCEVFNSSAFAFRSLISHTQMCVHVYIYMLSK